MAEAAKKDSTMLRSADGVFYEVPNADLKKYAVPPDRLRSVLAEARKMKGRGLGGPGGEPMRAKGGSPIVINVNLGAVLRGMGAGPGPGTKQGEAQGTPAGGVAAYEGGVVYRSCYRSCYGSCYRACYRACYDER